MKRTYVLALAALLNTAFASNAQKINLSKRNVPLKSFFRSIEEQTGYTFVYLKEDVDHITGLHVNLKEAPLAQALSSCLEDKGLAFIIKNKTIVVKQATKAATDVEMSDDILQEHILRGKVTDEKGGALPNVTLLVKGTTIGAKTDASGNFSLKLDGRKAIVIQLKSLGYKTQELSVKAGTTVINAVLEPNVEELADAVVTGIYSRSKESFTGSSSTFTAKELKMVGNQNILQALRTLDPSFAITDNNEFGSDPNTLPDINIRGKTSVIGLSQQYENDPNQPLFILDGYETSLSVINDLNIDRVESITILKDAAATAIYGAKSANGVIVVETKRPEAGSFKISYNLNTSVNFADLSDYNLMNSEEKLKFERLSGYYGEVDVNGNFLKESDETQKYNMRLAESKRGVDTYWMNEPLRVALSQSHNIYADGGDQKMRYGIGLTYGKTPGVMKGSERNAINGNLRLIYRSGNFSFANNLTIDNTESNREPVNFSAFSSANPYFRKYDEFGGVLKVLESYIGGIASGANLGREIKVFSPLYDASLSYLDRSPSFGFGNNLDLDWRVIPSFRLRGRLGINKTTGKSERFISPKHSQYDATNSLERGSYTSSINEGMRYSGDITATYGKILAEKHLLNLVGGMRLDHSSQINNGFSVRGFMEDVYPNPAFANGYATGSKPVYSETERRSASYYSNVGYVYDNRYLLDGNFRSDGSSLFGVENQFTSTWAVGLAWNIHNEAFMKRFPFISYLKLRGSVGNPGNQNFDARMTMNIYTYNLENQNPFGLSALVSTWGNQHLDWQKTWDKNLGLDFEVMDKRLRFNIDYFHKLTDPLLVFVDVPTSTGTSTVPKNIGAQTTEGVTLTANWQILKNERILWSVNANARHINMSYHSFGASLDRFNTENQSKSLQRFYEGGSPSDMWAVRSAGIDPATGREIFIKKDGTQTFVHDYADEVIVGNTNPKVEGVVGTSFYYKGFNLSMNFRYKVGGQVFQSALFSKVENLSLYSLKSNQDRRALYERWQKPGDIAMFKGISLTDDTPMSDRFVANENVFSAESISAGYDFRSPKLASIGLSGLTVRGYMNQIFRISSVKEERGINYPFARSFSFSVGARF